MFKFFLYARVSTKEQDFLSQILEGEALVNSNPNFVLVGKYEEKCSAYNQIPTRMVEMITDIENLPPQDRPNILVKNVDRFSRSVNYGTQCLEKILSLGVEILFYEYPTLNVSTLEGRTRFNILLQEAEAESKKISDRVLRSLRVRREAGILPPNTAPPFGKKISDFPTDERYVVDDDKEIMIQTLIAMFNLDYTPRQIRCALDYYNDTYNGKCFRFKEKCQCLLVEFDDDEVFYGNDDDFAYILNEMEITKRGDLWTKGSVNYQWYKQIKPHIDDFEMFILNILTQNDDPFTVATTQMEE